MTVATTPPPLPPALDAFFARTVPAGSDSSRERHSWTRREVAVALTLPEFPQVRTVEELFTTPTLQLLWDLGAAGRLRSRRPERPQADDTPKRSTLLARWSSLQRLLRASGCPAVMPERPSPPAWPHPAQPEEPAELLAHLDRQDRHRTTADPKFTRMKALVGLIIDTGARTAELHALRWDDFGPDLRTVTLVRRMPGGNPDNPPVSQTFALTGRTRLALTEWRATRDGLATQLQGSDEGAVWVTLSPSHSGPPGRTLALGGLARTYNTVRDLLENWAAVPLPRHLKDLSLVSAPHAVPLPPGPDSPPPRR